MHRVAVPRHGDLGDRASEVAKLLDRRPYGVVDALLRYVRNVEPLTDDPDSQPVDGPVEGTRVVFAVDVGRLSYSTKAAATRT